MFIVTVVIIWTVLMVGPIIGLATDPYLRHSTVGDWLMVGIVLAVYEFVMGACLWLFLAG